MSDTLDNLMKVHPPGTRFINELWSNDCSYFTCWFRIGDMWHGIFSTIGHEDEEDTRLGSSDGWSLWQEPKKKVKRWLWAEKNSDGYVNIGTLFMTDKEAETVSLISQKNKIKTNVEIEVDE